MSDNMNYNPNEMQDSPESSGGGYGQPNQPPNGNPYVWQAPPQQEGKIGRASCRERVSLQV